VVSTALGGTLAAVRAVRAELVGREPERSVLREFVERGGHGDALILVGEAGFGKTALWESAIDAARARGIRVLSTRANEAEAQLGFAGLIDLFGDVDGEALARLPTPQRDALEVALLRAAPTEKPPGPGAIALGTLNVVRALAADGPVVLAIDDLPWLDPPSADAIAFASRRLDREPVAFLLAKRPTHPSALERALEPHLRRVDVGPLSLGAIRHLLSERLGLSLPRLLLRRLVEATQGNPLFALEFGRVLMEQGRPTAGEALPVPDAVEDLLGARVARLSPPLGRLLLTVALSAEIRAADLRRLVGPAPVEEAVDTGLLTVDGGRMRASHPLLAAAARKRSSARERRALHAELAEVVADQGLRARHLALAADAPDETLATTVAAAAAAASVRGARYEAVELAEHAVRLTPQSSQARRAERVLALAGYLRVAGELQRITDLLTPEVESMPSGPLRARAWLLLAAGMHIKTVDDARRHYERALAESPGDRVLRAYVVANTSTAVVGVARIGEAEAQALEVLPAARADPEVERMVLYALAWARSLRGLPIDDVCTRYEEVSPTASHGADSPERIAAQRLVWRGELDEARRTFTRLLAIADERGEAGSYAFQRLHVCEVALRAGAWDQASHLLDEWGESAEREFLLQPMYERCRALLAAGRGVPEEAQRWAAEAIARAEEIGTQWDWLEGLRARGLAALLVREPARAAEALRQVWAYTMQEGVDEPGVFPAAPELVEALVELGELAEARSVAARLRALAEAQEHPWGLVSARRCDGLIGLAAAGEGEDELRVAVDELERLGLRFDAARVLLALGRSERRQRRWAKARAALASAAEAFDRIGSHGWAEAARADLERVPGRRSRPPGELTESERRAAELAASGLANKEIAQALFVSVHTVEQHLSRAYAKLGVRSRSQLAGALRGEAGVPNPAGTRSSAGEAPRGA
jgi:DNA-binding CsgD family transcriptional regulator